MRKMLSRLRYVLLESDPSLAGLMFGIALLVWGFVAINIGKHDLIAFAGPLNAVFASWVWVLNFIGLGVLFLVVTMLNFPPMLSLFVGSYACIIWTWLASLRKFPVATSGVTLNIMVIVMGLLLIVRSRRS